MNKNILITGREGFNNEKGFIGKEIQGGTSFTGDIRKLKEVKKQSKGTQGIVHLAGIAGWRLCKADPRQCISVNMLGTLNVLEAAKENKCWVIFISTYQIKETSLYGMSKLIGEELCRLYKHHHGVKVHIIRLPLVYGPNDKPFKVVTAFINQVEKGKEPKVNTDEKFLFTYVNDVAKIIENEVDIIIGGKGKRYSLYDLTEGIKKCLDKKTK